MLTFFNSLTKKKEEFIPGSKRRVTFYSCGPTVYSYQHIGNLRSYIFADTVKRALMANGYKVSHIINITDVGHLVGPDGDDSGEDKMEKAAREEGQSAQDIAKHYTDKLLEDLDSMHVIPPKKWVRATDHIKQQIKLIKKLEKKGLTYTISDGVYFDTTAYPEYETLLGVSHDASNGEHARIETNKEKKSAHDFALWKFSTKDQKRLQEWKSPWGVGFPGWHIECSAMSLKYLSYPIDIHSGGIDHYTIHHPNEIAQSEGAGYKPFVNYWLHHEHITLKNIKMAKSLGNIVCLTDLENKGFSPSAYRYYLLNTHYRQKIEFSEEGLQGCANAYENLLEHVSVLPEKSEREEKFMKKFIDAINDDLNTPKAIGIFWDAIKSDTLTEGQKRAVTEFADSVLGLELCKPIHIPGDIQKLAKERDDARAGGDYKKADTLRDTIEKKGYKVKDEKKGTVVIPS